MNTVDERVILVAEGLVGWSIRDGTDGYCWYDQQIIQRIPNDSALFLHEVAHAKCSAARQNPLWSQDTTGHHALWADCFTDLVRKYLAALERLATARRCATLALLEGGSNAQVAQGQWIAAAIRAEFGLTEGGRDG